MTDTYDFSDLFSSVSLDVSEAIRKQCVDILNKIHPVDDNTLSMIRSTLESVIKSQSVQHSFKEMRETLMLILADSMQDDFVTSSETVPSLTSAIEGALPYLEEEEQKECWKLITVIKKYGIANTLTVVIAILTFLATLYGVIQSNMDKTQQNILHVEEVSLALQEECRNLQESILLALNDLQKE